MNRETLSLPMVALRGLSILPEMVRHFDVSRPKSIQAIEEAMLGDQKIFLTAQKDVETESPGVTDVYQTGCVATIRQVVKLPKKMLRVLISGRIKGLHQRDGIRRALYEGQCNGDSGHGYIH